MPATATGADKVAARLREIAARVAETIVSDAATQAAEPLVDAMKANLADNVFLNRLLPGIAAGPPEREGETGIVVRIGPTVRGFTGRFLELGTSHQSPEPWARPAADSSASEVRKVFGQVVASEVKEVAEALS